MAMLAGSHSVNCDIDIIKSGRCSSGEAYFDYTRISIPKRQPPSWVAIDSLCTGQVVEPLSGFSPIIYPSFKGVIGEGGRTRWKSPSEAKGPRR